MMAAQSDSDLKWVAILKEYIQLPDAPDQLVAPVTAEMIGEELSRMRPGKCPGADGLGAEAIKEWPFEAKNTVAELFHKLIRDRQAEWPASWREAVVILLPKKAVWCMFGDLRRITLLAKLFLRILIRLMRPWTSLAEPWTVGFTATYQPSELTRSVTGLMEKSHERKKELHVVKTDLTNAYDEVVLHNVLAAMTRRGTPTPMVKAYLRGAIEISVRFTAPGITTTDAVHLHEGLPQGCPASPIILTVIFHRMC